METVLDHAIEAAVAAPPPRVVRGSAASSFLAVTALLLFGVFFYGGLRAMQEAGRLSWISIAGRSVTARITAIDMTMPTVSGSPPVPAALRYAYVLPGHPGLLHTGRLTLAAPRPIQTTPQTGLGTHQPRTAPPRAFRVGDTLPLRISRWRGATTITPWTAQAWKQIAFLTACGGLIDTVCVLLIRRLLRWQTHRKRLLRDGIATVGTIVHKRALSEDSPRYFVRYGFARASHGPEPVLCEREEQVTPAQWKRLDIGQPVTVLYDPAHADTAGLYLLLAG